MGQMRWAAAVRGAKARRDANRVGFGKQAAVDLALPASGTRKGPGLDDFAPAKQVVNVPVKSLVASLVSAQPPFNASHSAAGVDVETGRKAKPAQPADLKGLGRLQMDHQLIGTRRWHQPKSPPLAGEVRQPLAHLVLKTVSQ